MDSKFSESNLDGRCDQEQEQTEPASNLTTKRSFITAFALSSTLLLSAAALIYRDGNLSSISSLFGGNGGAFNQQLCPAGTYVTTIYASTGDRMDSIRIKCGLNDPFPKAGGNGGTERSKSCHNGFGAIRYHFGQYVGAIGGQCAYDYNMETIASAHYDKQHTATTTCSPGEVIRGFKAYTGSLVDNVEFICGVPEFGSAGGVVTAKSCSSSYISRMYGRQGHAVDRLGYACGNSFSDIGAVGGFGGGDVSNDCIGGFTSVKVTYGLYVSKISAFCKSSNSYKSMGQGIFTQSYSSNGELKCHNNQVLVSGHISVGDWNIINRVSYYCGDNRSPTASPTSQPIALPPAPGFGSAGGSVTTKSCSSSYISRMYGRQGHAVDRLGFACGDSYSDIGAVGGFGGGDVSNNCIGGFTSVKVTYGLYVSKISAFCKSSNSYKSMGDGIFTQSYTHNGELKCNSNQVLVSAEISIGSWNIVNRVHFICGENKSPTAFPSAPPLAQPTAFPFAHPTSKPVAAPTDKPIAQPTDKPIAEPTDKPIAEPTDKPISEPTDKPIAEPTDKPIAEPTEMPVASPSVSSVAEKSICPLDYPGTAAFKIPDGCMVLSKTDLRHATVSAPLKALLVCVSGEEPYHFSSSDAAHYGVVYDKQAHLSHIIMGDKISAVGKPNPEIPGYNVLFKKFHPRTNYYLPGHHFDFEGGSAERNTNRVSSNDRIFSIDIKSTTTVLNSSC